MIAYEPSFALTQLLLYNMYCFKVSRAGLEFMVLEPIPDSTYVIEVK